MKYIYEVWNNESMGNLLIADMKTLKGAMHQAEKMLNEGHKKVTITKHIRE